MSATRKPWLVIAALGFAVLLLNGDGHIAAEFQLEQEEFDPNELVGALTVRLGVGAGGEELAEPVALDLGLGFPLWLQPVGRAEDEPVPFGGVPQKSNAGPSVPAGAVAEFTFATSVAGGDDVLRTGAQLLSGVRISDISRIGFLSRGEGTWVLGSYEIEINGRLFAQNDDVNASVEEARTATTERLGELGPEIAPLKEQAEDIQLLADTELATEDDLAQLDEVKAKVQPLLEEQNRLERQLAGSYPWYQESAFKSPWRADEAVTQLRVSLVTAGHAGAETQNYVYYQNGGHKYLLSSALNPLRPEDGMREFTLDVVGAPLTAADMRGHALGMLAHGEAYGEAPDRWHCERLMVEVDGAIVYDSDENQLDRMSLQAVRVIPPAHYDEEANLVTNAPVERETFLWIAGRGQGLDLVNGGAAPLPGPDEADFPEPEPGLPYHEEEYLNTDYAVGFGDGFPPFPGEGVYVEQIIIVDPGWPPGGIWWPPVSWADVWGSPWWDWQGFVDWLITVITGNPAGTPVQVFDVRIVNDRGFWEVTWNVFGDDSQVVSYLVEIVTVRPHGDPTAIPVEQILGVADSDSAAVWERRIPLPGATVAGAEGMVLDPDDRLLTYLWPTVTPMTTVGPAPGAAGALRALTEVRGDATIGIDELWFGIDGFGANPFGDNSNSCAWNPFPVQSHSGFLFDAPTSGGMNVAVRVVPGDAWVEATTGNTPAPFGGNIKVVGHVGFAEVNLLPKARPCECNRCA